MIDQKKKQKQSREKLRNILFTLGISLPVRILAVILTPMALAASINILGLLVVIAGSSFISLTVAGYLIYQFRQQPPESRSVGTLFMKLIMLSILPALAFSMLVSAALPIAIISLWVVITLMVISCTIFVLFKIRRFPEINQTGETVSLKLFRFKKSFSAGAWSLFCMNTSAGTMLLGTMFITALLPNSFFSVALVKAITGLSSMIGANGGTAVAIGIAAVTATWAVTIIVTFVALCFFIHYVYQIYKVTSEHSAIPNQPLIAANANVISDGSMLNEEHTLLEGKKSSLISDDINNNKSLTLKP